MYLKPALKIILLIFVVFPALAQSNTESSITLKDAYKGKFLIGTAPNFYMLRNQSSDYYNLMLKQFNSVTPENLLKWGPVHPQPGTYNFEPADLFVKIGTENNLFIVGHTLVWHSQTPRWVFQDEAGDPATREVLIDRMKDHITTVVGRYKGKIQAWDVVNEALEDKGVLRESPWKKIIGDDFIEIAFQTANEVDPDAELYYNDYNLWMPEKCEATVKIVKNLQAKGIRIDGVGFQGHWSLTTPTLEEIEKSITAFKDLGVKVMITELDINVLPNPWDYTGADIGVRFDLRPDINQYTEGLPDSVDAQQAERYTDIFKLFLKYSDTVSRVTFWGIDDGHSWKNDFPVRGRTDYPLLFDRELKPKSSLHSIINLVK